MGRDTLRDRFVEELFDWSDVLTSIEEPAAAEVWASSAVAEWVELGGDEASLASLVADRAPLAAELIDWIVSGVIPTEGPEWVTQIGRYTAQSALEVSGDGEIAIVIEYASSDGRRHDTSVTIDNDVVVGLAIGPSGLAEAVREGDVAELEVRPVDVDSSFGIVREALSRASAADLSDSSRLNLPLFLRRFGIDVVIGSSVGSPDDVGIRDPDDERYAANLIRSALRVDVDAVAPQQVREVEQMFAAKVALGDPDALTLLEVAGSSGTALAPGHIEGAADDGRAALRMLLGAMGAYFAPRSLASHELSERDAIVELESADWVGAILGTVRSGVGGSVDGRSLVAGVNRCPEVASTIPKADAQRIAWAFELTLYAWQATGVLDEDSVLTEAAIWLLPRAGIFAWDPGSTTTASR